VLVLPPEAAFPLPPELVLPPEDALPVPALAPVPPVPELPPLVSPPSPPSFSFSPSPMAVKPPQDTSTNETATPSLRFKDFMRIPFGSEATLTSTIQR
jgi:hypothetical protein